jgi:nitrogen fixation-related uncharacterized protein
MMMVNIAIIIFSWSAHKRKKKQEDDDDEHHCRCLLLE